MGIPKLFPWMTRNFSKSVHKMPKDQTFEKMNINVDTLMIDMNGVFHTSAQKIYEYGNNKPSPRLMGKRSLKPNRQKLQQLTFEDVCKTVEELFQLVSPKKNLILCVDGPAPIAKQNQQRQRRFRSAAESNENAPFDTCSITPGTLFMDYLSKYIDWYIKKRISEDEKWRDIEVIFSNEKSPGEGEHKLINYIRYYGKDDDTYCIHGLDADLIMLSLSTHKPNFYVLREDMYDRTNEFFAVNIGEIRIELAEMLRWDGDEPFTPELSIDDFVFFCFIVGNDFLPHIPSMEIIEGGIDIMFDVYKQVGQTYGHLTEKVSNKSVICKQALSAFLGTIGQYEQDMLEKKMRKKKSFFVDELLEKHCDDNYNLKIDEYRAEYLNTLFPDGVSEEQICHEYLEGMQWVLSYYTRGVTNWKWFFPYHYSPFAFHLAKHVLTFRNPRYSKTKANTPFQQLLSVLPPKSAYLIPSPLCNLLTSEESPLRPYCPDKIKIDLSGKRKEWEGITLIPFVDQDVVHKAYLSELNNVKLSDIRRNISGKSFVYKFSSENSYDLRSCHGDIINCKARTSMIDL
jgi:5'-3' exoribonuclease 1